MRASVLFVGLGDVARARILSLMKEHDEVKIDSMKELQGLVMKRKENSFDLVFAGPGLPNSTAAEVGQVLKMCFPSEPVYYVADEIAAFDRGHLKKNGFAEVFLLPLDAVELEKTVGKALASSHHKFYSAVQLVDIEPGTKLEFQISVYLPANDRYLLYSAKGDVIDGERLDRLKKARKNSVFVPVQQLAEFYDYAASRLKGLSASAGGLSETERREKLHSSVRDLLSGMLSESYSSSLGSGMKVASHARNIVSKFILSTNPSDWFLRLNEQIAQQTDSYSHAQSVSTFAALFAVATGRGRAEEVAMGGLFHDLGIALLPGVLQEKNPEQMTPDERALYIQHPERTIEVLRQRKLVVPEIVMKAILQHHEKWGGGGYPNGIVGKGMSTEAQLLAVADRFDYLTRIEKKRVPMSPDQAIAQIEAERVAAPDLIGELKAVFAKSSKAG